MPTTLGIDHGTSAIRFCLLPENRKGAKAKFFELKRLEKAGAKKLSSFSFFDFLRKNNVKPEEIDLAAFCYSMGDAISEIADIKKAKNRGQLEEVTGEFVGLGTKIFDEIANSSLRCVLIPGLHRKIGAIDERFRFLYSHIASSEKVALSYHAFNEINRRIKVKNLLVCDISSSTATIAIKNAKFWGGRDACLAFGLLNGALDLETIRRIDKGKITANKAFYSRGAANIANILPEEVLNGKSKKAELALEALILAAKMEISCFAQLAPPEAIAIAGSAGENKKVFSEIKKEFQNTAPVFKFGTFAQSLGASEIARDILKGKRDFLGIKARW